MTKEKKRLNSRIYNYTLTNQGSRAKRKVLIIIDGNAVIHLDFHALTTLTTKKGEFVNAVYGFLLVFLKAIREFEPEFVAATFDFPGATFRHQKYKLYKANRPKTPDELCQQIPKIKEILEKFNIQIFEKKGYEADDLIGTISKSAPKKQIFPEVETIILSGDFDVLQLVDKNTKAYILKKGIKDTILYDEEKVKEKYQGLSPEQLTDFKALRGDPSDNIPGVTGVGEKTAIFLIENFGSLENLYKELDKNSAKAKEIKTSLREKLLNCKDQAFISKMLAEIKYDAPIEFNLEKCRWEKYDKEKVVQIFEKYDFKTLISRFLEYDNEKSKKEKSKDSDEVVKNNLKLW